MSATRWASWVALPLTLALWAGLAAGLNTPLLPGPAQVLEVGWQILASGELVQHLGATLRRVAIAFALAMTLGTLLGLGMGRSRREMEMRRPRTITRSKASPSFGFILRTTCS